MTQPLEITFYRFNNGQTKWEYDCGRPKRWRKYHKRIKTKGVYRWTYDGKGNVHEGSSWIGPIELSDVAIETLTLEKYLYRIMNHGTFGDMIKVKYE